MASKCCRRKKEWRLFDQMIAIKASYPSSICEIKNGTLLWHSKLRPTPLSKEYSVLMTYKPRTRPKVLVLGDELQNLDTKDFPHIYSIDTDNKYVEICLYRHAYEFSNYKLLANTIVPWTVEWLFYYEIWLTTGEWLGGGEHPRGNQVEENKCSFEKER